MRISIISFTEKGILLSEKLSQILREECQLYTKCSRTSLGESRVEFFEKSVGEWAKEQFEKRNVLVFIGACAIAVRAIAPYITDKLKDSPVLVLDERGKYVIPILSGHMGGANEIAIFIAEKMKSEAVITTATDINHKFAIDLFAKRNNLEIVNREGIAKISSKILSGKSIRVAVEEGHLEKGEELPKEIELAEYPPKQQADVVITSQNENFDALLILRPKEYAIGIGCKKGKELEKIEDFINENMEKAGIFLNQIFALASIDVKKYEQGLIEWSNKKNICFVTYTPKELMEVKGEFHKSDFVKSQVGVDNVCERAALKMCQPAGKLVYEKHSGAGMTIAIAKREWRVRFDVK